MHLCSTLRIRRSSTATTSDTQLDLFEKVAPDLAKRFTVYALDYPGHGYSDFPKAQYDADFVVRSVEGFLDVLDLRQVILCGVSIGGAIALIIAGRRNARVARVMAINPYDYAKGGGRNGHAAPKFAIMKVVLEGGVDTFESIPPPPKGNVCGR